MDFVSQMLKVIWLKISFKTRYMKKAVRMVGLSITYSTLQPTYKHAYAYAHALYLYISLQISSGKKKIHSFLLDTRKLYLLRSP